MWLYLLIGVLLAAAIGVQAHYARTYWRQAHPAARVVWCVNIALLTALFAGVLWLAFRQGVS